MLKVVTTQGLRNSKLYHAMKPNYFFTATEARVFTCRREKIYVK